jgi:hypothetical protein
MRTINLKAIAKTDELVGQALAKEHFPVLAAAGMSGAPGDTILWDWSSIDIVTASYVAGAVVPLIRQSGSGKSERYLIFAGLNKHCLEELEFVLKAEKVAVLVALSVKNIQSATVIGYLDPVYGDTLAEILKRRSVSASVLHEAQGTNGTIGLTGWIKRLTTLNELGLVRRRKVGREYIYEATYV